MAKHTEQEKYALRIADLCKRHGFEESNVSVLVEYSKSNLLKKAKSRARPDAIRLMT